MSECKIIKASKETFRSRKEYNNSNNNSNDNKHQRTWSDNFQGRNNRPSGRQENNNIDEEAKESDKEDNNNIQDIYDDEIYTLNENTSSVTLEASVNVNVALVQLKNKIINKNKTVKGLLDMGALSTFIKK